MRKFIRFIVDVISGAIHDDVGAYSAHTAFFITISFFPFIMLLISFVHFLPFTETELLTQAAKIFPQAAQELVASFIKETYRTSGTAIISITAITTLWAASIGVFSLAKGLNRAYAAEETRNYFIVRFTSIIYTIFLQILFSLCLAIFVFGRAITEAIEKYVPAALAATIIVMSVRVFVGFMLMCIVFSLMFTFVPNRKGRFLIQLPGAAVSSAGWIIFSKVFSYYYENLSNYSYIYGSLSVLVFFMIWLYVCIYILLVGAKINKCIEDRLSV